MNNRKKLMNIFYILSFFFIFSFILFIPYSSAITWTQSNGSLIQQNVTIINNFDQSLNTTDNVIFNSLNLTNNLTAPNICYSNGTGCQSIDLSSAGGWTNDSINTNTSKQVYINNDTYLTGTLTIENNQIVLKNATGFTTINITPSGQIIFNTRGSTTNPLLKFSGAFANTGWYDNGYGTSFEISGSPLFTISGDSGFVASAGIGTFKVSNGAQTMTFRPDTNNVMAIRQGRYATHTYGGLNIYAYAIDQSVPTLNFSRLMFIANATHPNFIIKGENNGYCPNCFAKNLTIDFPEADFTGDVDVNGTLTTVNGNFTGNIYGERLNINSANNYWGRWADSVDDYLVTPNNLRIGGASFNVLSVDKDNKGVTIGGYSPDSSTYQFQVNNFAGQGSTNAVYKFDDGVNPAVLMRFTTDSAKGMFGTQTDSPLEILVGWNKVAQFNTSRADFYTPINTSQYQVNGVAGLTTNKLINGSTSQCWLNFTSGLLTSSDC